MAEHLKRIAKTPWHVNGPVDHRSETSNLYEIHWNDDGECVAEIVHGEVEAHLLAAAPDMYTALVFCRSVIEEQGLVDMSERMAFDRATSALAKARGEAS